MVLKKGIYLFGLIVALLLVGCSGGYPIKTYDGEYIAETDVGILKAPENIDVISIDGVEMKRYLLENLAIDYHLLPGKHEIVFSYAGLWAKPKVGDEDRGVELVKSDAQVMTFIAEAGKAYTFSFITPGSRAQAYELAKTFSADLLEGVRVVATSEARQEEKNSGLVIQQKSDLEDVSNNVKTKVEEATDLPAPRGMTTGADESEASKKQFRLEALKEIWASATDAEKKAFLQWAFK